MTRRSAWKALENRNFKLYFVGSLVSNLGTWMQNTAQVLLAYDLTHSAFGVGVVTFAQFSGSLFLGPWAVMAAARFGGKRMLVATQAASAAIAGYMAILAATNSLDEKSLIVGALSLGLVLTFALPIQTALVPRLMPDTPAATKAAVAMNSVSYNAGRAVAPVISVVVITTTGFAWAFAANAISFLIFTMTLVVLIRVRKPRIIVRRGQNVRVGDGIRVALQKPRVMLLLAMVAAVTFADDPVLIQGPALAHHQLHAPNDVAGYFLSMLGLGTVLGSLWPTRGKWDPSGMSKRAARALVCLFAFIVIFAAGLTTWICLLAAVAAGVAVLHAGALAQAQLTRYRPDHIASVMALWAVAWAGAKPVASLVDGWLASHVYLWLAAAILATPALVLGLVEILLSRETKKKIKEWWKGMATNWPEPSAPLPEGPATTPVEA
jgi:MFS family permease